MLSDTCNHVPVAGAAVCNLYVPTPVDIILFLNLSVNVLISVLFISDTEDDVALADALIGLYSVGELPLAIFLHN